MRGIWVIVIALCLGFNAGAQSSQDGLFQAIRNNDIAALKAQLAKGAGVDSRDKRGNTPLMQAATFGSVEALKLLLNSGADVNTRNQFENTALILAATDPEKAALLVERGADVNAHTKQGRTPLMVAARCDDCSRTVGLLLSKGADAKAKDVRGTSVFQAAADGNDLDTIRLLLSKGADADGASGAGDTALQSAASNCNPEAVNLLLSKGAKVDARNTFSGEVKFGKIQMINLTPLMFAVPYCSANVIKPLLDAGADVNARDIREMTPLMLAVASETQDLEVVRLLLKAGANVDAKSSVGETPLDWAKKFGNQEVIAALIRAGAKEGTPYTAPKRAGGGVRLSIAPTVMQAVQAGTNLLQRASTEFFKQSGCVGCHHQPFTSLAVAAARGSGIPVDDAAAKEHIKMSESQWASSQEALLEHYDTGGLVDPPIYSLMAMAAERYPANNVTDTLVAYIADFQRRDGAWRMGGASRAPLEESVIGRTALALHALQLYSLPARHAEFDQRIARARDWLLKAKPATNDDAAMQMLGLHWGDAKGGDANGAASNAGKVKSCGRTLGAAQRRDGGWAQNPNLASDAYATGESLWALREAGVLSVSDAPYQRGVKFLLSTQWEDGSWYVRSRAVKFQPYFQSGFPFDHDQWISATATAWAVRALAPAIQNEKRASR
jgi:ankyrin repeat protein